MMRKIGQTPQLHTPHYYCWQKKMAKGRTLGRGRGSPSLTWLCACLASFFAGRNAGLSSVLMSNVHNDSDCITMLDIPKQEVAKLRENSEEVRVAALCACLKPGGQGIGVATTMDNALNKLSELAPEISYAGMHRTMERDTGKQKVHQLGTLAANSPCEDYVESWLQTRLLDLNLDASNTTTVVEMIYTQGYEKNCGVKTRPLNESISGRSSTEQTNIGGFHIRPKQTHFKRHIYDWGEVFSSKRTKCKGGDEDFDTIHTYRSRLLTPTQEQRCTPIHVPTILHWADRILSTRLKAGHTHANETVLSMLTQRRSKDEARQILSNKQDFCVILTLSTFKPFYSVDALIRHALSRLLTKKYKPCLAGRAELPR